MRQLSALDALFLAIENDATFGHTAGLMIIDPSTSPTGRATAEDARWLIRQRMHLIAPLRWRLMPVPLGLDHPYWFENAEPDLEYHVRDAVLPAPGNDSQLAELVARLHARPLDRTRPLWETYVISGLEGGRAAVYLKVHHAVVDGISAAEVLGAVTDLTPEPWQPPPFDAAGSAERPPGRLGMLTRGIQGLAAQPLRTLRALPGVLPYAPDLPGIAGIPGADPAFRATGAVARFARLTGDRRPERPPRTVPATPFNGPISRPRIFAFGSLPLGEVKEVKNAFGLTVNDVVMALCATALRRWLDDHGSLPEVPLVAGVPVSIRTAEQRGTGGNQVSMLLAALPTHLADPAERLHATAEAMHTAKKRFGTTPGTLMQELATLLPEAFERPAVQELFRLSSAFRPFNLFISNVPGPQFPLYMAGARILGIYPVSAVSAVSGGMNITVTSYAGQLDFGIIACSEMVPDAWKIIDYLGEALEELKELAGDQVAKSPAEASSPLPAS